MGSSTFTAILAHLVCEVGGNRDLVLPDSLLQ